MTRNTLLIASLALTGCGYVGEPLPPLLNIPQTVKDLTAVERGDRIVIEFTVPKLTTEGVAIKQPVRMELRAGVSPAGPFQADAWAAQAQAVPVKTDENGRATAEAPAARWVGTEVIVGVVVFGSNGRQGGWSNLVTVPVVAPLGTPVIAGAQAVAEGVRLSWSGGAESARILRKAAGEEKASILSGATGNTYLDATTEYGKTYEYRVIATAKAGEKTAESDPSAAVLIVPKDTFPPATPTGLTVVPGTGSIELVWEPNPEPDLAGYRIYRAQEDGEFSPVAGAVVDPSFSDRSPVSGKRFRYAVTAFDKLGNESPRTAAVEATAP